MAAPEAAIHDGAQTVRRGYVYMLASKKGGTVYTGVTNDLSRRVYEHKIGKASVFTRRYAVNRLVWYQEYPILPLAIQRETSMKRWPRAWKIALIEKHNPGWKDLSAGLT
jgi:putative endonuclease